MKKLNKIKLLNATVLGSKEMKDVFGGSGYDSTESPKRDAYSGKALWVPYFYTNQNT